MKALLLSLWFASPVLACGDGSCEPPAPEPPAPTAREFPRSDRDRPTPEPYWPCCIRAGEVEPRWNLFLRPEATKRMCERALARGEAIYECPDLVSPAATK